MITSAVLTTFICDNLQQWTLRFSWLNRPSLFRISRRGSTVRGGVCGTRCQNQLHQTDGTANPTQIEYGTARTSHAGQEIRHGN